MWILPWFLSGELPIPPIARELVHPRVHPLVFRGVRVAWILVFCVLLCRSSIVLLSFFFWPFCFRCFFDLRLLITPFCWFMVFNATFDNISVISWRSVLLLEETGEPGENHIPSACTDKLYYIMLYSSPWAGFEPTIIPLISSCY